MNDDYQSRRQRFLALLKAATEETGIYIEGCGCCESPSLEDGPPRLGSYTAKDHGGCLTWHPDTF